MYDQTLHFNDLKLSGHLHIKRYNTSDELIIKELRLQHSRTNTLFGSAFFQDKIDFEYIINIERKASGVFLDCLTKPYLLPDCNIQSCLEPYETLCNAHLSSYVANGIQRIVERLNNNICLSVNEQLKELIRLAYDLYQEKQCILTSEIIRCSENKEILDVKYAYEKTVPFHIGSIMFYR